MIREAINWLSRDPDGQGSPTRLLFTMAFGGVILLGLFNISLASVGAIEVERVLTSQAIDPDSGRITAAGTYGFKPWAFRYDAKMPSDIIATFALSILPALGVLMGLKAVNDRSLKKAQIDTGHVPLLDVENSGRAAEASNQPPAPAAPPRDG